ncbi:condensation domain-containing protein [Pedobacter roseus]|uniref:Condensation domain-containing protein n=1 Tax=Pedobacter roseus TaxID=336820 RepID=A0A7G9QKR8_9SPHI|nr:condensation domain-containing protein [Pedobacter roseus]QNN43943.1 hypothetical protein H9L23_07645 [Pedobacter roseus]
MIREDNGLRLQEIDNWIEELKLKILSVDNFLDKENIEDIYPMSDIEKGMTYGSVLNRDSSVYHSQMVQRKIFSDFDIGRFSSALDFLIEKHSILRTGFNLTDYETEIQIVYKKVSIPLTYENISDISRGEQEIAIQEFMKAEIGSFNDISRAPLWQMNVFNLGENELVFVFQSHHAIIDGWSESMFLTELNNLYLRLEKEPDYRPDKLKTSYRDFILQHELDKSNVSIKSFWKKELEGHTRLDIFAGEEETERYSFSVDSDTVAAITDFAQKSKISVKSVALSAFVYLLKVLEYGEEVITGVVTNTRPTCEDSDKILGCFLNTIPFRVKFDEDKSCSSFMADINQKLIELKAYERLSLLEIAKGEDKPSKSVNPFFDVIFNYVDFHSYNDILHEEKDNENVESINLFGNDRTNTYLDFTVNVTGGNLVLVLI